MTLENLKQYRPGVMLADDESNGVHRIRAGREVHGWLRGMTAEQRGEVLTEAYARARAGGAGVEAGSEARPGLTGVEPAAVKVDVSTLTGPERRILELIEQGAVLVRNDQGRLGLRLDGRAVLRVQHGTLNDMLRRGLVLDVPGTS